MVPSLTESLRRSDVVGGWQWEDILEGLCVSICTIRKPLLSVFEYSHSGTSSYISTNCLSQHCHSTSAYVSQFHPTTTTPTSRGQRTAQEQFSSATQQYSSLAPSDKSFIPSPPVSAHRLIPIHAVHAPSAQSDHRTPVPTSPTQRPAPVPPDDAQPERGSALDLTIFENIRSQGEQGACANPGSRLNACLSRLQCTRKPHVQQHRAAVDTCVHTPR